MKARENFERIRRLRDNTFNLRVRMVIWVTALLVLNVVITLVAADILERTPCAAVWKYVSILLFALLCGIGVTSALSRYFFRPIRELQEAMERVADGDFGVRLETDSSLKEIREVYSGFNLMVHELSDTQIAQDDFISCVSHEFKTPIAAIEGYSTLLQGDGTLDGEEREYVEKILYNTKRLSGLVGNILLLSRLEHQSIETNQTFYRLDEQIRESVVALAGAWEKKQIEFDVELESVRYRGNEALMRLVWDNLIDNAIKFSPQNGSVRLCLFQKGEKITVTVEDCGPGVPEDARRRIFEKFYQADNAHRQEGCGLGLALVRRILQLTGGDIQAENRAEGGCRFTVTLSVSPKP